MKYFLIFIFVFIQSFGQSNTLCSDENYKKIMLLYQYNTLETAKNIFQILDCTKTLASNRAQYIALIGGFMQRNPQFIDTLYHSAQSTEHADTAAKIYLDALWVCHTKECQKKLKDHPFGLPEKDANALLAETPPDVFSIPMNNPATLDYLWSYFFGTGDTRIVKRFLHLLKKNWHSFNTHNTTVGINKATVLSTARWSLISIAQQQKRVKRVLVDDNSSVSKALLKEIQ